MPSRVLPALLFIGGSLLVFKAFAAYPNEPTLSRRIQRLWPGSSAWKGSPREYSETQNAFLGLAMLCGAGLLLLFWP